MEVLSRGRRLADLDVVLAAELEVALHAGARMLRPLPFVAVREEHHDARKEPPLVLARGDELIDDDLGAVGEVAELRLPADQGLGKVAAVAVLEAEDGGLGEHRVVDLETGLVRRHMFQRRVLGRVLDVDQHRVALVEGAAPAVLPREADGHARLHQRGEGQSLGQPKVDRPLAGPHLGALLEQGLDLLVDVEPRGRRGERTGEGRDLRRRQAGPHLVLGAPAAALEGVPVVRQGAQGGPVQRGRRFVGRVELGADRLLPPLGLLLGDADRLGVEPPRRRVGLDLLVEEGLGDRRVVHLAVAVAAEADEVHHHVALEGVAVVDGHPGHVGEFVGDDRLGFAGSLDGSAVEKDHRPEQAPANR